MFSSGKLSLPKLQRKAGQKILSSYLELPEQFPSECRELDLGPSLKNSLALWSPWKPVEVKLRGSLG